MSVNELKKTIRWKYLLLVRDMVSKESGLYIKSTQREQADAYFINKIKARGSNKLNLQGQI